ncbi:hypothetical protein MGH68_11495 [Erysipelothrix sp. D19-032]
MLTSLSKRPFMLTGTFTIMIIALVVRRLPYTIRSSVAILQQISISVEEAKQFRLEPVIRKHSSRLRCQ